MNKEVKTEDDLEAAVALVALRDGTRFARDTVYEELVEAGINDLADAILELYKGAILPTPPSRPFVFEPWLWPGEWPDATERFRTLGRMANSREHVFISVFICNAYGKNNWYITECANDIVWWAGDDPRRILQALQALQDATAWCYTVGR